jgi:hypothetical protein
MAGVRLATPHVATARVSGCGVGDGRGRAIPIGFGPIGFGRLGRLARSRGTLRAVARPSYEHTPARDEALLPVEGERRGMLASLRTMGRALMRPAAAFRRVREPVAHAPMLELLAWARLLPWVPTIVVVAWSAWRSGALQAGPASPTALDTVVGPAFAFVASLWLLALVPLGIPVLYFLGGVAGHLGLVLSGGVRRSVGASMRAFAVASAPILLLLSLAELGIALRVVTPEVWFGILNLAAVLHVTFTGVAMARTHEASLLRGWMVAPLMTTILVLTFVVRAGLLLPRWPGEPPPREDFPGRSGVTISPYAP